MVFVFCYLFLLSDFSHMQPTCPGDLGDHPLRMKTGLSYLKPPSQFLFAPVSPSVNPGVGKPFRRLFSLFRRLFRRFPFNYQQFRSHYHCVRCNYVRFTAICRAFPVSYHCVRSNFTWFRVNYFHLRVNYQHVIMPF